MRSVSERVWSALLGSTNARRASRSLTKGSSSVRRAQWDESELNFMAPQPRICTSLPYFVAASERSGYRHQKNHGKHSAGRSTAELPEACESGVSPLIVGRYRHSGLTTRGSRHTLCHRADRDRQSRRKETLQDERAGAQSRPTP